MRALVISNDITPGFGLPVAAPGIRAAGLAAGLRSQGLTVDVAVPQTILDRVWSRTMPPPAPADTIIVNPSDLAALVTDNAYSDVIYTNANMAPHLDPAAQVRYIYDLFAPKLLELLCSGHDDTSTRWTELAQKKERAFAMADHVFVNGHRKLGYALGWLTRPSVQRIRTERFGRPQLINGDPARHCSIVEMAVPLPDGVEVRSAEHVPNAQLKIAIAGYAQSWSAAERDALVNQLLDAGHELRLLTPKHWGNPNATVSQATHDARVKVHEGALGYGEFARWLQECDVVLDAFDQSSERTLAMITRTAVAVRLGVPSIHAVDSETADILRQHEAGWICPAGDIEAVVAAAAEAAQAKTFAPKQSGAVHASEHRFSPPAALASTNALWSDK